ncbi:phosphate/phosphite/phosphonate ABC transporter substrate-binding protein [Algihabitans albus]|uniref:phosphate/phosphite/phosphonate ABC transporter substrate-binding protein n=1 Tax=Algihabitans albus TaxID=2164067 RepID=UPI000E5C9290|nr:PhnD/SsuA/transferrin family substrate-binding protein [Algihabitans albus]
MSLASLPMYDLPELRWATDRVWQAVSGRLRIGGFAEAPAALTRTLSLAETWSDPDLLLSQTCGYPLTHAFAGRLSLVAVPLYDAEGCESESRFGPTYRSAIVVRVDDSAEAPADLKDRRAAINDWDSQSGMSALRALVAPLAEGGRFFSEVIETGGHAVSVEAVAEGRADVAAIDCVTWALLGDVRPRALESLRVLTWSVRAPALPFVTSPGRAAQAARIGGALTEAMEDPALTEALAALRLIAVAPPERADYRRILEIEAEAEAHGYPVLR